jgi:hypothetical protein
MSIVRCFAVRADVWGAAPSRDLAFPSRVVALAGGETCSLALLADGSLFGWGTALCGEFGGRGGGGSGGGEPEAAQEDGAAAGLVVVHPVALLPRLWAGGAARPSLRAVACGSGHVLAACSEGRCFAWGRNSAGQLGTTEGAAGAPLTMGAPHVVGALGGSWTFAVAAGDCHSLCIAVAASDRHSLATAAGAGGGARAVWAWGCNAHGQLGLVAEEVAEGGIIGGAGARPRRVALVPEAAGAAAVAAAEPCALACGWSHSACVSADGALWTWGWGLYLQLGHGEPLDERRPRVVRALDGIAVGVGNTGAGAAGIASRGVAGVACGAWHTAALSTSGDLYSWGWGRHGQLGHQEDEGEGQGGGGTAEEMQAVPRLVKRAALPSDEARVLAVACGTRSTAAASDGGLSFFGRPPSGAGATAHAIVLDSGALGLVACGSSHVMWSAPAAAADLTFI